jgi:hypothetical protein
MFNGVENEDGTVVQQETILDADGNRLDFFCLRAPYLYLKCWVHRDSLPPRQVAFPLEPDMSFEGEFYEIVHTRNLSRGMSFLSSSKAPHINH